MENVVNNIVNEISPDEEEIHSKIDEIAQEIVTTPKVKNIKDHVEIALTPAQQAKANQENNEVDKNLAKAKRNRDKRQTAEQLLATEALKAMSIVDKKNAILSIINEREEVAVGFVNAVNQQKGILEQSKQTFNKLIFKNTKENVNKDPNTAEDVSKRII